MIPVERAHLAWPLTCGPPVTGRRRVLHRGPDAVYVDVAGRCVGVVGTRATQCPCALRQPRWTGCPTWSTRPVRGGVLHLDGEPLVVGRLVDVAVPRLAMTGTPGAVDVASLVGSRRRADAVRRRRAVRLAGGAPARPASPTPRSTPQVRALLAPTTTLLSATLLDCAMHGEVIPEFAACARRPGTAAAVARRARPVGHTSGRGLLEGARLALCRHLERVAA